jgi:PAS domain S-box-containing protein
MGGNEKESCVVTLMKGDNTPVSAYIQATGVGPTGSCRLAVVKISSAEKARLALREREAHRDLALTAASIGVWEWERNTGDVYCSRECVSIFGIDSICPTLESVAQLLHPEDLPRVRSIISQALAHDEEPTVECRIVRPNGDVIWILAHGRVRLNEAGEPLRLFGIVQDVTERKRAEQNTRG